MTLYCTCAGDFDLTFADKVSTLKDRWVIAKCSHEGRFNADLTSASLSLPLSVQSFSEQITVFRNIASHYNMGFLEEMIDWLGAMSPNIKPHSHWVSAASMESTKTWGKLARHWDKKKIVYHLSHLCCNVLRVNFIFLLLIKIFIDDPLQSAVSLPTLSFCDNNLLYVLTKSEANCNYGLCDG